jgi:hypothetical protein
LVAAPDGVESAGKKKVIMRRLILVLMGSAALAAPAAAQMPPDGLGPRTLLPAHIMCAELPMAMSPSVTLRIVGPWEGIDRRSYAKNDLVVLPGGTSANLAVGQRFIARRVENGAYTDPMRSNGFLAVRTAGVVTVIAADQRFAIARVEYGCDEVAMGDYLEPYTETALPRPIDGGTVDWDDRARVLFGNDRRELFGDGDIFSFDRGSEHGILNGARVVVYRDRHDGLPLVEIGHAVVVEVSARTSKAVVVKLRLDRIQADDVVVRWK